jgi:hypothetical protein
LLDQEPASIEIYLAFLEGRGRAVGTRRCATGMLVALDRLVTGRAFEDLTLQDLTRSAQHEQHGRWGVTYRSMGNVS